MAHPELFRKSSRATQPDDNGKHPKSWEFKKDKIVITNVTASSPKGGFKDTCTIHPDGQKFDAKNQLGAVFTGKRID